MNRPIWNTELHETKEVLKEIGWDTDYYWLIDVTCDGKVVSKHNSAEPIKLMMRRGAELVNSNEIVFYLGAWTGTLDGYVVYDTDGLLVAKGKLDVPLTVTNGISASFQPGALGISLMGDK